MKKYISAGICVLMVAVICLVNSNGLTYLPQVSARENIVYKIVRDRQALLEEHNKARKKVGVGELKLNNWCNYAAQERANMIKESYGHNWPEGQISESFEYIMAHAKYFGENLSRVDKFTDVDTTTYFNDEILSTNMEGWIASPTHYENITNDIYTNVGFGISEDDNYIYTVAIFATDIDDSQYYNAYSVQYANQGVDTDLYTVMGQEGIDYLDNIYKKAGHNWRYSK